MINSARPPSAAMPTTAGSTATTPFRSPITSIRSTWALAPCASSTKTASRRQRLRHARPPRHGDRHLRARRRAGAQGQHGHRLGSAPTVIRPGDVQRMSAGTRRPAQRVEPLIGPHDALPADLDPAASRGIRPSYEQKAFDRGRKARPAAHCRVARRPRRIAAPQRRRRHRGGPVRRRRSARRWPLDAAAPCLRARRSAAAYPRSTGKCLGCRRRGPARRRDRARDSRPRRRCRGAGLRPRAPAPPLFHQASQSNLQGPRLMNAQDPCSSSIGRVLLALIFVHVGLRQARRPRRHGRLHRKRGPAAGRRLLAVGRGACSNWSAGLALVVGLQGALGRAGARRCSRCSPACCSTPTGRRRRRPAVRCSS